MILKDVLKEGVILKSLGNEAPHLKLGLLYISTGQKVFLYTHDDYKLNEKEYREFIEAVRKELMVSRLIYYRASEFMSLILK